jgi:5,10-methylene-tetrahydrofolate dehydrogenase/methenyl tetrahydrofolate cyclohydrolase
MDSDYIKNNIDLIVLSLIGIRYELREVDKEDLLEALECANNDPEVHGILIYYPCFGAFPSFYGGTMDDFLRDSISIKKDVEVSPYIINMHKFL